MDKVLILSGDARLTSSLKSGLDQLHQFTVSTANTGEEAVALIDKIRFSVFVTDINPPEMDALDLLSYMTLHRPNIPCIVMTDKGKPWFREKMAKQSFLYHLEKPIQLTSLVSAIMVGLNIRDEGQHFQGMTMASVLPLIEILEKTCRMEARSSDNQKGYLYFNKGVLIDAHLGELRGEAAALEIAGWERITIKFSDLPHRRTRTKVKTGLMDFAGACWDKPQAACNPEKSPINQAPKTVKKASPDTQKKPPETTKPPNKAVIPLPRKTELPTNTAMTQSKPAIAKAKPATDKNVTPIGKTKINAPAKKEADVQTPADRSSLKNEEIQSVRPAHASESMSKYTAPPPEISPITETSGMPGQANLVKDMYLDFFQLAQKPFQINTDPSFLWLGEKQKEALATLKYGLQENKSFLLLTGDVGVGKTTIVKAMLQGLGQNDRALVIHHPTMEPLDFFNYIAKSFGLAGEYKSKGAFLEAFSEFLLSSHYRGERVLLIIDECQLLDPSLLNEIRLFLNFEKKGTLLINIFFVGQLEFNNVLLQPENRAIRQRIAINYTILPLSLKETEKYIEYRLAVAGANRKIFKTGAIREIFTFSKGYPRLINIIADRALLTGYINSTKIIKKGIIKECAQELDIAAINKIPADQGIK